MTVRGGTGTLPCSISVPLPDQDSGTPHVPTSPVASILPNPWSGLHAFFIWLECPGSHVLEKFSGAASRALDASHHHCTQLSTADTLQL